MSERSKRIEEEARGLVERPESPHHPSKNPPPDCLCRWCDIRRALAMVEDAPRVLRDRVSEPAFQTEVAALVAAGSVKCRCGREADEHFIFEEDIGVTICDGFVADLSQPVKDAPDEYRRGWTDCMVAAVKWAEQMDMGLRYERDAMFQHLSTQLRLMGKGEP